MTTRQTARIVDIVYNPLQETAFLTLPAFPDSEPDDHTYFKLSGPYCELRRSPREHLIFKIKNRRVLDVLRKAREVQVSEIGEERILWNYKVRFRKEK